MMESTSNNGTRLQRSIGQPPPLDLAAVGRYLHHGALAHARTLLVRTGHQVERLDARATQLLPASLLGDATLQAPAALTAIEGEFLALHGTGIQLLSASDTSHASVVLTLQTDSGVFIIDPANTGVSLARSNNLPTVTLHGTCDALNAMFAGTQDAAIFFLAGYDTAGAAPLISIWLGDADADTQGAQGDEQNEGSASTHQLVHIAISTDAAPLEGPVAPEWAGITVQDQAVVDALRGEGFVDEAAAEQAPDHDALLERALREEGLIDEEPMPALEASDDDQIEQDLWHEGLLDETPEPDSADEVDRSVEDALREEGLIDEEPDDEDAETDRRVEQELRDLGLIDDEAEDEDALADQQLEEQLRQEGLIDDEPSEAADAQAIEALRAEGLID